MTQYRRTRHIAARTIEGRAFIINTASSTLHELDECGTFLWERIPRAGDAETLAEHLIGVYEVDAGRARADTTAFLSELEHLGLIEPIHE